MPELAEVEFYRNQWNPGLQQTVQAVLTHPKARIFRETSAETIQNQLIGKTFHQSFAHGKQMLFHFQPNTWLGIHLGMTGKLLTAATEIVPAKSEHLVIKLTQIALVFSDYRMFGKVSLFESATIPKPWKSLPPSVNSHAFTFTHFRNLLQRRPNAPLKSILLDQSICPGIGNWMADEILWRAHILPHLASNNLSPTRQKRLFHEILNVTHDAMKVIAPNWSDPPDSWLFNHRWKKNNACPRCQATLQRATIASRSTAFCSTCQK